MLAIDDGEMATSILGPADRVDRDGSNRVDTSMATCTQVYRQLVMLPKVYKYQVVVVMEMKLVF